MIKTLREKKEAQAKVVHTNYTCDNCGVNPIVGIRYKCSFRPNYDLCQKCELDLQPLQYAMIKIRNPNQPPVQLQCQYENQSSQEEVKEEKKEEVKAEIKIEPKIQPVFPKFLESYKA